MYIEKCIRKIRPNDEFTINGDSYGGLVWISKTPKPTLAELEAVWPEVQAEQEKIAWNAPIYLELDSLDKKRVRPLAEGDTEYLTGLNEQIINLRATLRR